MLAAVGCADVFPNKAPELVSINGIEIRAKKWDLGLGEGLPVRPGERLDLTVEVRDRQGHPVRVWFVAPPPGLEFDPDGTSGHWDVPPVDEALEFYPWLEIAVQDVAADPRSQTYPIPLQWDLDGGE